LFKITRSDNVSKLENPGVSLILVASRGLNTYRQIEYTENLFDLVK